LQSGYLFGCNQALEGLRGILYEGVFGSKILQEIAIKIYKTLYFQTLVAIRAFSSSRSEPCKGKHRFVATNNKIKSSTGESGDRLVTWGTPNDCHCFDNMSGQCWSTKRNTSLAEPNEVSYNCTKDR